MQSSWHGLFASFGVVAIIISLWSHSPFVSNCSTPLRKAGCGLLFGIGAIASMSFAFEIEPGVILDLRNCLLAVTAFVGGPFAGLIAGLIAAAYRFHIGGAGAVPGTTSMAISVLIGYLAHRKLRGSLPQRSDAFGLAFALAAGNVLLFWLLPSRTPLNIMMQSTGFSFAAVLLAGLAMSKEVRRQSMARDNLIYGAITEALPDCLNVKDIAGHFLVANPATARLMQAETGKDLIGKSDADFYPPDIAQAFRAAEEEIVAGREARTFEQFVTRRDGSTAWLSTLKAPVFDAAGKFQGLITHNRDITDRKKLEAELVQSQQNFADAFSNMADGLVMYDSEDTLVFCNTRYQELFPLTRDIRVPGARYADIIRISIERGEKAKESMRDLDQITAHYRDLLHRASTTQLELQDGRWVEARVTPTANGCCFAVYSDVTALKQSEKHLQELNAQLEELAQVDALTCLLNRRSFDKYLDEELSRCSRGMGPLSVLLIDVDKFKIYNDTYGHPAGDACLQQVATAIKGAARRTTDRATRYGGEEFALILPGAPAAKALQIAEDLRQSVQDLAITHAGSPFGTVTISIGLATVASSENPGRLAVVKQADEALYQAKGAGRNAIKMAHELKSSVA